MSQEKIDKYKKEKANREKIQKREKRIFFLEKLAIGVVVLGMVGMDWLFCLWSSDKRRSK